MNIRKRLLHLAHAISKDRRQGRTTLTCKAAKEIGAIILAGDFEHAKYLEREFGVTAKSIETNLDGLSGPFLMDHWAMTKILESAARKIEILEKEQALLKSELFDKNQKIEALQKISDYYQQTNKGVK